MRKNTLQQILILGVIIGVLPVTSALAKPENAKDKSNKYRQEVLKLKKEIANLTKENMDLKTRVEKAQKLNVQLEKKAKALYLKTQELKQIKREYKKTSDLIFTMMKERANLKKEIESLKTHLDNSRKEAAKAYCELGNLYFNDKRFEQAIGAYHKSLEFNPYDAAPYYKLGLLYKHSRNDAEKSIEYLKKYLELSPDAPNKKEVKYLIEMMSK